MNREKAFEHLRNGRRVRPPQFVKGYWLKLSSDQDCLVDAHGEVWAFSDWKTSAEADGWTLLNPAPTRAELKAQLAEAKAEAIDARESQCRSNLAWQEKYGELSRFAGELRADLVKAEKRAAAAEATIEDLKQGHIGPAIRMADLQLSLKLQAEGRANAAEAECKRLRAELDEVKKQAPRLKEGDRPEPLLLKLLRENPNRDISQGDDGITFRATSTGVRDEEDVFVFDIGIFDSTDWAVAPEPCSECGQPLPAEGGAK